MKLTGRRLNFHIMAERVGDAHFSLCARVGEQEAAIACAQAFARMAEYKSAQVWYRFDCDKEGVRRCVAVAFKDGRLTLTVKQPDGREVTRVVPA